MNCQQTCKIWGKKTSPKWKYS